MVIASARSIYTALLRPEQGAGIAFGFPLGSHRADRNDVGDVLGNDKEQLHSRSPVYNANLIEASVMLIHGESDWRADFEQATRMKAALEKNGKPVEWLALAGEGHGIYNEESRRQVYERVLAFLDRNLMQKKAVAAAQ